MMMIVGDVAVLQPRDYEDFQAWVPHRRDLDEDEDGQPAWVPTPECYSAASMTCYEPLGEAYGNDPLEKIRNTDLREICEYVSVHFHDVFHVVGGSHGATENAGVEKSAQSEM